MSRKKEETDKMDFLMRTIKAVHSASVNSESLDPDFANIEGLEKHRSSADAFSKLITPSSQVLTTKFEIDEMECEWTSPKSAHRIDTVILYCHGGGYISGGLGYAGVLATKLALNVGVPVMSFEYRLAPEHKYPSALEDAIKAWDYLMKKGYGAKNVIVAGDSAGGNMALELCLHLKETERLLPKMLILMSPWTDFRLTSNSYKNYKDKDPLLTYEYVAGSRNAYLGDESDFENPKYSPLLADLSGMPPTLVQVGSNEILRDDSEKLSKNYAKYGSLCKLEVYQGGWHVFQQMPIPRANKALDSIRDFVNSMI